MRAIGSMAKACVAATLTASMLLGCVPLGRGSEPESDVSEDRTTKAVDTDLDKAGKETTTGSSRIANSESSAENKSQEKGETSIMDKDTGISAYVLKAGYLSKMDDVDGTIAVGSRKEWEDFLQFGEGMAFAEDGTTINVISIVSEFKDYDQAFFDEGNKLLIAYQYLSTGAATPTITSLELGQDGALLIGWNDGLDPMMMVTDDMSGFLTIAEIPAGMDVTEIRLESDV